MAGVKPTHQCGRVERLFKTVQDRRVKERRLAGGSTLAAANRLLDGYLPIYTRRFSVQPAQPLLCIGPVLRAASWTGACAS